MELPEINSVYRNDLYELPVSAIREMIANAVVHRSYLDKSCVQVCIFDDRIEVLSPGMLYGGLDMQTAKLGKSTCRNEAIAEAFHYMHIVEAWGTGIPRIINRCREYSLPEPLFEEFGVGVKVTMFKKAGNTLQKVSNEKVYNQCLGEPFGQQNVMEWLKCSKSKATNVMNAMKKAKVIKKVKGLGAGKYVFIEI